MFSGDRGELGVIRIAEEIVCREPDLLDVTGEQSLVKIWLRFAWTITCTLTIVLIILKKYLLKIFHPCSRCKAQSQTPSQVLIFLCQTAEHHYIPLQPPYHYRVTTVIHAIHVQYNPKPDTQPRVKIPLPNIGTPSPTFATPSSSSCNTPQQSTINTDLDKRAF